MYSMYCIMSCFFPLQNIFLFGHNEELTSIGLLELNVMSSHYMRTGGLWLLENTFHVYVHLIFNFFF